jgi:hypothetical protein
MQSGEMAMDEDADQDRIEKFDIAEDGESYTLKVKTKSEEFEFIADRKTFQELADEIYYFLDKNEKGGAEKD